MISFLINIFGGVSQREFSLLLPFNNTKYICTCSGNNNYMMKCVYPKSINAVYYVSYGPTSADTNVTFTIKLEGY